MSALTVSHSKQSQLSRRMADLGVREDDLAESFVRSSGPGGQNVNKTSTAVVLVHLPTGLQVRCEDQRSQAQNRAKAREMLMDRLEAQQHKLAAERRDQAERLRRQTRKRPYSLQERILKSKARRSEKKRLRGKWGMD